MLANPFTEEGEWHRANLHAHTTASDGRADQAELIQAYQAEGYSVLAVTDHEVSSAVSEFSGSDFLLIDGVEVSVAPYAEEAPLHLVCLNIPRDTTVPQVKDPNDMIAWTQEEGGEALLCHPYWSGNTTGQLLRLRGHVGIEIFNASCRSIGKGYATVHWDNLLAGGAVVPGVAVDDTHGGPEDGIDVFGGWAMLRLEDLSTAGVMDALRSGCFYSSSGAEVTDFGVDGGQARVRCSEAAAVHLMGANWHGASFYQGDGQPVRQAETEVDPEWQYVRAEIVGTDGGRAWTNPVVL
jgi:hypothetical protein